MILLERHNVLSAVTHCSEDEKDWLKHFLSFTDSRTRNLVSVYDERNNTFPSGFIGFVEKEACKLRIPLAVKDARTSPNIQPDVEWLQTSWLREDQKSAVLAALQNPTGIIKAATSFGKGDVATALMRVLQVHWLFIVPNKDLLQDMSARVQARLGEECGIIGDDNWYVRRITVATFQTLNKRLHLKYAQDFLKSVQGLIADECHGLASDTFFRVVRQLPNAYWRLGLSATPVSRGDDRNIWVIATTGDVIFEARAVDLIAQGVVARPCIKFIRLRQMSLEPWAVVYKNLVVRSSVRNRSVVTQALLSQKPCLVSVQDIEHGENLVSLFHEMGQVVSFIHGETSTDRRIAAIEELATGQKDILIASVVLNQGQVSDKIRSIRTIINASAGKSTIRTIQRVGRGMRLDEDKNSVSVIDFLDEGQANLRDHALARLAAYKKEGFDITLE